MYIYNYMHIWQAARNVKNLPANNYSPRSGWVQRSSEEHLMKTGPLVNFGGYEVTV